MVIRYFYISFFILFASSCAVITGEDHLIIVKVSLSDAEYIVQKYMAESKTNWEKPALTRVTKSKYEFTFYTPPSEIPLIGRRTMYVDSNTGEITFPHRY